MTYAVLAILSDGCPPLKGRLPTCYSPVRRFTRQPKPPFSLDLHVLSPPLTFALSQDQTLHLILITFLHGVSLSGVSMTGFFSWFRLGFSAIQFSETDSNLPSTFTCGPRILFRAGFARQQKLLLPGSSNLAARRFRPTGTTLLTRPSQKGTPFRALFFTHRAECSSWLLPGPVEAPGSG
jgi:hypothetical protein